MAKSQSAGDFARALVLRQGGLYFADVLDEVRTTLHRMSHHQRVAFAVWCADAMMQYHERLPASSQRPFTLSWRPILDSMITGLEADWNSAATIARSALESFRTSPYNHSDGQDGPDDADDAPAAASIYAAECAVNGDAESAFWCVSRVIDYAFTLVPDEWSASSSAAVFPAGESLAADCLHPIVQGALTTIKKAANQVQTTDPSTSILSQLPKLTAFDKL